MSQPDKRIKRYVDELSTTDPAKRKAIAIQYNVDADQVPRIVAAGQGDLADKILKMAEEHNIVLFEDPSLSDLMSKLDINKSIPLALFPLVAEVLAIVYKLDSMAKKRQAIKNKKKKTNNN